MSAQSCLTLQPHGLQPTRFLCPWDSPGKNTGAGCHFLLQGIFPIQGLNLCLLRWQADFHHCATWESPIFCQLKVTQSMIFCYSRLNGLRCPCCVCLCSVVFDSLRPHGLQPARLLCPWDSPGKNNGVDYCFLLQGIFLTQGLNLHLLCLLHFRLILYH